MFENPKQPDKKIVSSHLDKLFHSIRLQMQFLVKVLLGKRWKCILDSLVNEERSRKKEGSSGIDEDDGSDTDARKSLFCVSITTTATIANALSIQSHKLLMRAASIRSEQLRNHSNHSPKIIPVREQ